MIDFYALLGVNNNQLNREIKNAYRKLALKYHPDRYQGDINEAEEMMKLLNEAKDVLLNEEKRQEYDNALHSFKQFKTRQQKEAERRQAREDYDRWQKETKLKMQQEVKLKDSIIKNFKEKLLQEEKSQLLAEAERLVREAEEQRNQEALARTLKKRNRILLVFTLIVIGLFINISLIYLT